MNCKPFIIKQKKLFAYPIYVSDKPFIPYTAVISLKDYSSMASAYNQIKSNMKGMLMSILGKLLLWKRPIIESINDEIKNIAQVEHYFPSLREQ